MLNVTESSGQADASMKQFQPPVEPVPQLDESMLFKPARDTKKMSEFEVGGLSDDSILQHFLDGTVPHTSQSKLGIS
jgi:hypothetical protein